MTDYQKMMQRVGQNIHRLRCQQNIRIDELAALTKRSARSIDRLEMGRRRVSVDELYYITDALDTDLETLFKEH